MEYLYGKNVLVTGASSGIGKCTAQTLAKCGFHVYGASRRGGEDEEYNDGFVKMIKLDVTDEDSIDRAVGFVIQDAGSIDILVNAAGNGICGAVDECSADDAYYQLNTNYLGTLRMINAIVPNMRKRKKGLVVNIGSVGGIYPVPFQSLYSSSKFAVEAMTECMRIELAPFNVKATLIEPGDIKTGFTAARVYAKKAQNSEYGEEFKHAIAQMEADEQGGDSPQIIADAVKRTVGKKNPPVRVVVGMKYKFFVFLKRLFPAKLVELLLTMMYPKSKA